MNHFSVRSGKSFDVKPKLSQDYQVHPHAMLWSFHHLTLLHSERPKLLAILAFQRAIGLIKNNRFLFATDNDVGRNMLRFATEQSLLVTHVSVTGYWFIVYIRAAVIGQ